MRSFNYFHLALVILLGGTLWFLMVGLPLLQILTCDKVWVPASRFR